MYPKPDLGVFGVFGGTGPPKLFPHHYSPLLSNRRPFNDVEEPNVTGRISQILFKMQQNAPKFID